MVAHTYAARNHAPFSAVTGNAGSLPGKLFIVEGIDGSGKSTQLELLHKWLISRGHLVVFSEWNSSPIVATTTRRGKKRHLFTPLSFSLIHAADFASRTHAQILPALRAGAVVLADRYVYTAYARDAVRGVSRTWLRKLYSFAVDPTVAFYFDVPLEEAVRRIESGRDEIKYYESGMDLGLAPTPAESFRIFQGKIKVEYDEIADEFGLVKMDATLPLVKQQQQMRALIRPHLEGVRKASGPGLSDSLVKLGLSGRYLNEEPVKPVE